MESDIVHSHPRLKMARTSLVEYLAEALFMGCKNQIEEAVAAEIVGEDIEYAPREGESLTMQLQNPFGIGTSLAGRQSAEAGQEQEGRG
jgi:hypothetical protein